MSKNYGSHSELSIYLKLQADPDVTPWWELYGGLEVPVGVKVEALSHVIADYQVILIDNQQLIAEAKDAITFASHASPEAGIYVMNSDIGRTRKLSSLKYIPGLAIQCPTWSPSGEEIGFFWSTGDAESGDIYIIHNDGTSLRNSTNKSDLYENPAWSPNGDLFAYGAIFSPLRLVGIDSSDSRKIRNAGDDQHPDWSPDGARLVFNSIPCDGCSSDIFVISISGANLQRLTDDTAADRDPVWSPDGLKIAFASYRDGDSEIFVMKTDGSNIQQLTSNAAFDSAPTWSPDGAQIAFVTDRDGNNEIYIMNADGSDPRNITKSPDNEYCPDWYSP